MTGGIFITGTDTDVGKTYVAAGIAAVLKQRGVDVGVMKPVETGCSMRAGRLVPRDALRLIKAAEVHDSLSQVNPYRFQKPLAPSVAADFERKKINLDKIINTYRKLSRKHEVMIVEGAGGIMVPLTQDSTNLDLAEALSIPVLIVARPGLGTINHTLLTISALRECAIPIAGIVINYTTDRRPGLAERTSPLVMERMSGVKILGIIPYGTQEFGRIIEQLELFSD